MGSFTSRDGTRIAFCRGGAGPPLLLVHGATTDHTTWRSVLPGLERRFLVLAMDRRGRGGSGDSPDDELRREAEDVAGLVDSLRVPVNVVGHSYGGLCALEAALLTANLRRVILYEAVPLRGADGYPPGIVDRLAAILEVGDVERMLTTMMRELIGRPPDEIELLRAQREDWAARLRNAPTMLREMREEERYVFEPARFVEMATPTYPMVGWESPSRELENARGVARGLPHGRVVLLPGQRHTAMYTAPELFVTEVVRLLEE